MWLSSLQLCTLIASSVVPAPLFSDVYSSCESAYGMVKEEKEEYGRCVRAQMGRCGGNLEGAAAAEAARVERASAVNAAIVGRAGEKQAACSAAFTKTTRSLESWAQNSLGLPYTDTCTDEQKEAIGDRMGEIAKAREDAFKLNQE